MEQLHPATQSNTEDKGNYFVSDDGYGRYPEIYPRFGTPNYGPSYFPNYHPQNGYYPFYNTRMYSRDPQLLGSYDVYYRRKFKNL